MSSSRPELRLDWADARAARFACERWHYTGCVPNAGVRIGVWEGGTFAGVILFGVGAARSTDGRRYGLSQTKDVAELVRVALKPGHVWPVSRCVSIAIRMLRRQSPGLRLLISFADAAQGHHGGIYQAGGWTYAGTTDEARSYIIHGKRKHARTITSNGWSSNLEWLKANVDPAARIETLPPKHRYLMPLDDEMRARIAPLARPYPKRTKEDAAGLHPASRGCDSHPSAPTSIGAGGTVPMALGRALSGKRPTPPRRPTDPVRAF